MGGDMYDESDAAINDNSKINHQFYDLTKSVSENLDNKELCDFLFKITCG
jgi:hypothetical protein